MNVFKGLLDIIFPRNFTCDLCGREVFNDSNLCEDCAKTVHKNDGNTCPKCGRKTDEEGLCFECKDWAPLYDKAFSAFVYDDGVRALITRFKNGKSYLADYFAEEMYKKYSAETGVQAICYVPMYPSDKRKRGYNQSELLAKRLSSLTGLPLLKGAIEKVKKTQSQKSLQRKEREENLKGCFMADKSLVNGKTILLVDDVLTTGATADAVTRELKKRGAKKVYFITVASVRYHPKLT